MVSSPGNRFIDGRSTGRLQYGEYLLLATWYRIVAHQEGPVIEIFNFMFYWKFQVNTHGNKVRGPRSPGSRYIPGTPQPHVLHYYCTWYILSYGRRITIHFYLCVKNIYDNKSKPVYIPVV